METHHQPDLLPPPVPQGEDMTPAEIDAYRLMSYLTGRRWRPASQLGPALDLTDRQLRAAAAASGDFVLSGQRGYCLITEATAAEVQHASGWLISQGKKMIARGVGQRALAHRLISPKS